MNKKIVVNRTVLALLGEEESREIDTMDGVIFRTEDRHYLHRIFGRLGKKLLPFATRHPISNQAVQELVSAQRCEPLVALGLVDYATSPCRVFDLHLIVDDIGKLMRVEMTDEDGNRRTDDSVLLRTMEVQDFIYRCIGKFYGKGA